MVYEGGGVNDSSRDISRNFIIILGTKNCALSTWVFYISEWFWEKSTGWGKSVARI